MTCAAPSWPRRILVVDDAPLVLDLFRDLLSHAGFEVDIAQSATAAMACLVTRQYALVVAECVLSDLPVLDNLSGERCEPREEVIRLVVSGSARLAKTR